MLLSAVFVLVVAQSSSEIPEGLINNPVHYALKNGVNMNVCGVVRAVSMFHNENCTKHTNAFVAKNEFCGYYVR